MDKIYEGIHEGIGSLVDGHAIRVATKKIQIYLCMCMYMCFQDSSENKEKEGKVTLGVGKGT